MVNEITTPIIIAMVVAVATIVVLFWLRNKNSEIRKESARLKQKERSDFLAFFSSFPFALIGLVLLASVVLIQSIGFILSQYIGFDWVALGFIFKAFAVVLILYMILAILTRRVAIDTPARLFTILILFAILVAIVVALDQLVPQLFSQTELFSSVQIFG